MARYMLEVGHEPEDCVSELDSLMGHSHELLSRFNWACKDGQHVGWAIVEAGDQSTARMMLPIRVRSKARVFAVHTFTPEEIRAMHESG